MRALGLALTFALITPLRADAQGRGGGNAHGGGRPAASSPHAGAAPGPGRQSGGFNFQHDLQAPAARPAAPGGPGNGRAAVTIARPPSNARPPAIARPPVAGPPANGGRRQTVVTNPARRGQRAWEWNRGVTWAPAPAYWGGGFWGPFAFGAAVAALGAAAFGAFTDPTNGALYPSYQVAPGSPGAALLENYQLTQTPCGPPDLVVIFGPDNSVICAAPNSLVGPGEYDLDSATLTLVSQ